MESMEDRVLPYVFRYKGQPKEMHGLNRVEERVARSIQGQLYIGMEVALLQALRTESVAVLYRSSSQSSVVILS